VAAAGIIGKAKPLSANLTSIAPEKGKCSKSLIHQKGKPEKGNLKQG